ncbi:hypothetical protein PAHAL_9G339000 [Panicum hallii]|uniref:Uncharacterized protein n=1 Tax=Panicum hallii TaxID=206008 RepID=A0A2T8I3D0_9POAL|nr:hypothetical protein PAHAL_9G339000 [Panicum hallii]
MQLGARAQGDVGRRCGHEGPLRVAGGARLPPPCTVSGCPSRRCGKPRRRRMPFPFRMGSLSCARHFHFARLLLSPLRSCSPSI